MDDNHRQQLEQLLLANARMLTPPSPMSSLTFEDCRTLLLIDESINEDSFHYFKFHTAVYDLFDAEAMNRKSAVKKQSVASILEEARFQLVYAMKYGKVLVIRMGYSMVDFKYTYCDEECPELTTNERHAPYQQLSYLPRSTLLYSGQHLKQPMYIQTLFRRSDKFEFGESNEPVTCHKDFKIIITTRVLADRINDFYFNYRYGLPGDRSYYNLVRYPFK